MTTEELIAAIKESHAVVPYCGLWLTTRQIEHIITLAERSALAKVVYAVETTPVAYQVSDDDWAISIPDLRDILRTLGSDL